MNITLKDYGVFCLGASAAILVVMLTMESSLALTTTAWGAVVACLLASLGILFVHALTQPSQGPVDIWDLQRRLMHASDQKMPMSPELNAGVMLYFALTLEELGEMASTIHGIMLRDKSQRWSRAQMGSFFHASASTLTAQANQIKKVLPAMGDFTVPLSLTEAVALFDDTTDVTVTVAGLPISAGLPAAPGYLEVLRSNLSKANPSTGKIDKDASGKWVKGRHFQKPDLARVLKDATAADYSVRGE